MIKMKKILLKKVPRREKRVLGHFDLNSKNGVNTRSWRILGNKKYYLNSSKINFAKS